MVLVQKWPFFETFVFQAIQTRKISVTIFYKEKIPFQVIKTKSSKSGKIDIFPKGLTDGSGANMAIFFNFFFQAIQARKMSFTKFQNEKIPYQAKKTRSSKSQQIDIFPMGSTHGFGPKMVIFPNLFYQAIQARKMSFTISYNEKTFFQAIKTKNSKSRKLEIFPKGLTHGFGPKMAVIPTCFLGNIGKENVFHDILERNNAFLGYKSKKFKKS